MYAICKLLSVVLAIGLLTNAVPSPTGSTTSEDITYILPIWEGSLASHAESEDLTVLSTMKNLLGIGGTKTKLGWSFSSWAMSRDIQGPSNDYNFDPKNLNYMLGLGLKSNLPILVHMNNGSKACLHPRHQPVHREQVLCVFTQAIDLYFKPHPNRVITDSPDHSGWADCCTPNSDGGWGDALLDHISNSPNTTMLDTTGASQYSHNGGGNYFTLSRLNLVYRGYRKRNSQASAKVIASWAATNPGLFAGVSLSSETIYPKASVDFNPLIVEEWRQYLRNAGIYGPGGEYFGSGRVPAFADIHAFNKATGQTFASWSTMQPPRTVTPGDPFFEEWERWRVQILANAVSDEALWIAQAGVDRNLIFSHQTPRIDDYSFADSVDTFTPSNGAGGVTYYGWDPANFGEIDNPMRGAGKNNFGVFELNPLSTDGTRCYNTLLTLYNDGAKAICPNSWESDEPTKDQYAIFDSPQWGDTFGLAIKNFLSDYGNTPRNVQPVPWNPGARIFDLYDLLTEATSSGPDNHREPAGSVGNVVRKSIYSAVQGTITYTLSLPAIASGQRLNFWASLGIKDGSRIGGEIQYRVTINGASLIGRNFHLNKNYWVWNRWVPIMVDVSYWAGQTVTLELSTLGNAASGNAMWGSPAVYQTGTSLAAGNNLALGKTVTVSSSDGLPGQWSSNYVTDGNIDGPTGGRIGWSSISHPSAWATEWVVVDLDKSTNIGKVVLFARSDLVSFAGTGFPTGFDIQGSTDSSSWTTLLHQLSHPNPKAGEGQIFTFPSATVRYIRVLATALRGVGNESGYRFQLAEIEVFA